MVGFTSCFIGTGGRLVELRHPLRRTGCDAAHVPVSRCRSTTGGVYPPGVRAKEDAMHTHNHAASWRTAAQATLHCLTGCAIGEVLGMVIGTAAGLSNTATVVLSIAL